MGLRDLLQGELYLYLYFISGMIFVGAVAGVGEVTEHKICVMIFCAVFI